MDREQLLRIIPAACHILDSKGIILDVNDPWLNLFGYRPDQVVGKPLADIVVSSNDGGASDPSRLPEEIETRITVRRSDGVLIPCSADIGRIASDPDGSTMYLLRDLRETMGLEERLRDYEEIYNKLYKNAPVGIFEIDIENKKFLNCNDVILDFLGYTREEFLSSDPIDLLSQDSTKIFLDRISRALKGEKIPEGVEYKVKLKDGSEKWFQLNTHIHEISGKVEKATVAIQNINQKKIAVDALRESELRFRELTDLLPQTIFELDLDGIITYTNRCGLETTGYTEDDLGSGKKASDIFIPGDRKRLMENIADIKNGKAPIGNEYTLLKQDGSTIPVLTFTHPITKNGTTQGLRGVLIDISELKASEEALRKSEEKFRTIVDNSQIGMMIFDSTFHIQYLNDRSYNQLGYTKEEMIGRDFRIFLDEDTKRMLAERFIRRQRGEDIPNAYEFRVRTKTGDWRTIDIRSNIFADPDGNVLTIAQMMDITEKRRATEALRVSEMRSRAIFDFSPVGFILSDYQSEKFFKANQSFCKMLGYTEEELLGRSSNDITHTDDINTDIELINDLKKGKIEVMNREKRYIKKNGEIIWANTTVTIIRSIGREPQYSLAVVEDITEHKKADQEIIDQRNRAEFYLDLLSHDIGNIHQGLYNWIEIAQSNMDIPAKRDMAVDQSWHLVNRSMKLVKNVLLLANIRSRSTELEPVDIIPLIEKSLEDAVHIYPNRTMNYDLVKPEGPLQVLAEPIIEEAFFNIIQNAVKFQMGSDVKIDLDISTSENGKKVIISIRDHGPGISPEMKDEIFLKMKSEKYNFRSGVGLYLVKELVDRYGGEIEVLDRVPGDHLKGARFDLIFDLAPPSETH